MRLHFVTTSHTQQRRPYVRKISNDERMRSFIVFVGLCRGCRFVPAIQMCSKQAFGSEIVFLARPVRILCALFLVALPADCSQTRIAYSSPTEIDTFFCTAPLASRTIARSVDSSPSRGSLEGPPSRYKNTTADGQQIQRRIFIAFFARSTHATHLRTEARVFWVHRRADDFADDAMDVV